MPLAGDSLFAAKMTFRKAGLICQPLENAAVFLANLDRHRVDFEPFLGFKVPPREPDRPEISSRIQRLARAGPEM